MWSIGCILYLMLTGMPPFNAKEDAEVLFKVQIGKYSETTLKECDVSDKAIDFIANLLLLDPAERLTAEAALKHPWILDWRDDAIKKREEFECAQLDHLKREKKELKKLQEATIQLLIKQLHPDELTYYEEIFRFFDEDGNGNINRAEMLKAFRAQKQGSMSDVELKKEVD